MHFSLLFMLNKCKMSRTMDGMLSAACCL